MPLVEDFVLLDHVLTVLIVGHDYSILHISHRLELVFACVSYPSCSDDVYVPCSPPYLSYCYKPEESIFCLLFD